MSDAPPPGAERAPTVLVVDDEDTTRKFIGYALRAHGFRAVLVRDGLEALETLAAGPADLVVLDLTMPGLDGHGLLRALRAAPDTRATPVIVLSALSGADEIARTLALGADAYLVKPLDAARLLEEAARLLPRPAPPLSRPALGR